MRGRLSSAAATAVLVIASACSAAPSADIDVAESLPADSPSLAEPALDRLTADIRTLTAGRIEIVEEWTIGSERHRVTHDLAFDVESGVVRQRVDARGLAESLLVPVTEWAKENDEECAEAALAEGEQPGEVGCGSSQLVIPVLAMMLTETESFSIGDPREDDPGVVVTVGDFVDVMNNAGSRIASQNPGEGGENWWIEYPPLDSVDARETWGSLEPWADQVPFALYVAEIPRALGDVADLATADNTTVGPDGVITVSLRGQQRSPVFLSHLFGEWLDADGTRLADPDDIELSIVVSPVFDRSLAVPPSQIVSRDELLTLAAGG